MLLHIKTRSLFAVLSLAGLLITSGAAFAQSGGKPAEQAKPAAEAAKDNQKKIDEIAEASRVLKGPAGNPECVWLGRRVVTLLWRDDLDTAFKGARGTKIVLCHAPDHAPILAERGADLVLSGHTHGGQIYFPGITDRLMKKIGLNFRRGFFQLGDTTLYVTPGVGFSGITRRIGEGTTAEVAVLTLRAA